MHNFLRYPLCSIPSAGGIDPGSAHHAPVPPSDQATTDAKYATRQAQVMPDVQPKVSHPEAMSYDQAGTAIDGKALSDRGIQPATGESLPSVKGDQLDKPDQTELKETQDQLLKQADELLKKSSEKKAVTASLSGLKKSVAELKKAQNDGPMGALEALQKTEFPPALKVKITLGSGEKLSLIPPGEELKNQSNLGELMEKAVKVLEKHNKENFASFDQASTDREISNLKQQVSDIDQQIGEESSGINDFARLENRRCLLTINVRARVEDGSVNATHIDGGPLAQQTTMGSVITGPVHRATTDQPPQTGPEAGRNNDRPVMPEATAQDLTDSSPADQAVSINSTGNGGDTDSDELDIEVTYDNPVIGAGGQDTSLIPGIVQSPSEQTDSTPGKSSQPDGIRQTGDNGEDYSELDGVAELFAEPDTVEDYGELDGVAELFAEPETQQVSGLTSALATEETIPSLTSVAAGIEDSDQSETAMYRSDDNGNSQDSIPEETALTADRPDTPDSSVSSDSDYFSEDEDDQITTQALRSETDFSSDVAKESAQVEMAQTVRQSTANIREIAKRRMQEKRQFADSAPVSKTPSPATSSNHNATINRNRDDANRNKNDARSSGLDRSRADQSTAGTTRSSTASRTAPDIINKPVDVSGVKSVVAARINATRKAKSTDAIPKQERAIDKKKLGVSSTYNEANVIENAYDRLQNNADNLKGSQDIARTARKYIASEAQDSGPFLPGPTPKESKALRALGLGKNASERDIRLALLNKASESAESNSRAEHVKTMRALTTLHNALFK